MAELAPGWLTGAWLRACFFEPTFHKHVGQTCQGIQVPPTCPPTDTSSSSPTG